MQVLPLNNKPAAPMVPVLRDFTEYVDRRRYEARRRAKQDRRAANR